MPAPKAPRKTPRRHKVNNYEKSSGTKVNNYVRGKAVVANKAASVPIKNPLSRILKDVKSRNWIHVQFGARDDSDRIEAIDKLSKLDDTWKIVNIGPVDEDHLFNFVAVPLNYDTQMKSTMRDKNGEVKRYTVISIKPAKIRQKWDPNDEIRKWLNDE